MTLWHALAHWRGSNQVKLDVVHGLVVCQGCDWVRPMEEHRLPTCEPLPPPVVKEVVRYVVQPSRVVRHEHIHYQHDDGGMWGL